MSDVVPADGHDIDEIAAALRADTADLDVYARVFSSSLAESLPDGMVTIERKRSLADRMAGRDGAVSTIRIAIDDWELTMTPGHGADLVAHARKRVRGVAISSREVDIDEWVQLLAAALADRAKRSADARVALGKLLGQP